MRQPQLGRAINQSTMGVFIRIDQLHLIKSIVIVLLFIVMFSCENDPVMVNEISYVDTLPVQTAKNIKVIYSDSGKVQAKIVSQLMNKYVGDQPYYEFPEGINIIFYDTALTIKTTLTANYAVNWEKKNIMEARNDVVIINHQKDEKINTEHIVWDQVRKKIFSDVFVKRTTKDDVLYGDGFDADESFSKYTLRNPRGTFHVDADK
ncbi:LPS export ABC transporter periplasmic protein LptC [Bacteroidota bacterium]